MSYAHTKRRKTITRLKKQTPKDWKDNLKLISEAVRVKLDGPLLGTLEELMKKD